MFTALAILALTLLLVYITPRLFKYVQLRRALNKIAGPSDIFLIGNAHIFETDPAKFQTQLMEFCKQYANEKIFRVWIGPIPLVICHCTESVEKVLSSAVHINKSQVYEFLHPWLGEGLLTSSDAKWKSRRRILTPAFHFKILQDFLPVFNKQARIMVDIFNEKLISKMATKEMLKLDIFPYYTLTALDIICETAMAKSINAQTSAESPYVKAILELSELFMIRCKTPWLQNDLLFPISSTGRKNSQLLKTVHNFTDSVIKEMKAEKQNNKQMEQTSGNEEQTSKPKKRLLAFLDLLLEYQSQGAPITDRDIREEVDTFMFEGHDTTAAAMTWASFLLATHPDTQDKVHEELDSIFEDDFDRDVTVEDLTKMTYLEKVIKEALRLYPSVPYIGRRVEKENVELCGYYLPPGTSLVVLTSALHRRPDIFGPDPDTFRPERFNSKAESDNTEPEERRNPFAYVPFSAGQRNCIGAKFAQMEEKIVLSHIFRNFKLTSNQTEDDLAPASELILRPSKPVMVTICNRRF